MRIVAALCFCTMGIASGGGGTTPKGQPTPSGLLERAYKAMQSGNETEYIECFLIIDDKSRQAIVATFTLCKSAYDLYDSMESSYGSDAVKTFRETEANDGDGSYNLNCVLVPRKNPEWASQSEITTSGDNAVAMVSLDDGQRHEWPLVCTEGGWLLDSKSMAANPEEVAAFLTRLRKAVDKTRPMVGKPGIGIRDLKLLMIHSFRELK